MGKPWDGWQQPATYRLPSVEACKCGETIPARRGEAAIAAWREQHSGEGHGQCTASEAGRSRRRERRAKERGEAA